MVRFIVPEGRLHSNNNKTSDFLITDKNDKKKTIKDDKKNHIKSILISNYVMSDAANGEMDFIALD